MSLAKSDAKQNRVLKDYLLVVLATLCILTVFHNLKFLSGNPALFDPAFQTKYMRHWPLVFTHGVSAMIALLVGPFQFMERLRKRWLKLHRILGRVYVFSVLVAAPTGLIMGTMAHGGLFSQAAFVILSVLWFWTTWKGFRLAVNRRIIEHKDWMIRSFALTFGAVVLRLELNTLQMFGFEFDAIYPYMAFTSWIPCLVVAEILTRVSLVSGFKTYFLSVNKSPV